MLKFDLSYFEDEVREGFYIPGMIKRLWAEQLAVLDEVRQICIRHNLRWFADYGTLIGAARHGGYIPWDDDLDICMLREDLEVFLKVAPKELPESYLILDTSTEDRFGNFLTRITNNKEIDYRENYLAAHNGYPFVAGIDIFPLDYLYQDEDKEKERCNRAKALFSKAGRAGGQQRNAIIRDIIKTFTEASKEGATYVAPMYFWTQFGSQKYPLHYFEKTLSLPFENTTVDVPAAYADKLTKAYGGWEKANRHGGMHDYPSYWDQEELLAKHLKGSLPYKYKYSKEDLIINKEEVKSNTETCLELLEIIDKANRLLKMVHSSANFEEINGLLNQCQDLAIKVGTIIEFCNGMGTQEVSLLEEYCENVFTLFESLSNEGSVCDESLFEALEKDISEVISLLSIKPLKKLAVFVPYKASYWKRFEETYEELIKTDDVTVKVLPSPIYYKKFDGSILEERNEFDLFDSSLPLISMEEIDFNLIHADCIYYQNAFDDMNLCISLHPLFYSDRMVKYARQLIYIPEFSLDSVKKDDEKGMVNAKSYIVSKGILKADKIILDNEDLKRLYIDILTEAAGQENRNLWESRIEVRESIVKSALKEKKTLLFYTSLSDLYTNGSKEIDKIDRVLKVFSQNKETLNIIWRIDCDFRENLKKACPEYEEQYLKLIDEFNSLSLGSISTDESIEELLKKCQAYYGAKGYVMNLSTRRHIPIMIMNCDV